MKKKLNLTGNSPYYKRLRIQALFSELKQAKQRVSELASSHTQLDQQNIKLAR